MNPEENPPPVAERGYHPYKGMVRDDGNGNGDERAVSAYDLFADKALIQSGTSGLHGCTVVYVISSRASWGVKRSYLPVSRLQGIVLMQCQAHFLEVYSNGPSQTEEPRWEPVFKQRVLDFIEGKEVPNPIVLPVLAREKRRAAERKMKEPQPKQYFPPDGESLEAVKDMFTEDDEPFAFIMTPLGGTSTTERWYVAIRTRVMMEV